MVFRVVPSITLLIFFLHSSILDISLGFLTRISTHERPCYLYKKKIKDISSTTEYSASDVAFSYVEFYSGVGGWTMALDDAFARLSAEEGIPTSLQRPRRIAALDHSDLCTKVFQHNFGTDKETFQIERLTLKQVEEWQATIWTMSPPCQPHTRQHKKQKKDLDDPRSSSFLHLCSLILEMKEHSLPRMICCENVVGFESSNSFQKWRSVLSDRNYLVAHFHLSPTQVGMPNDRPRYYCVAIQENSLKKGNIDERTSLLLEYLRREDARSNDLIVHGCIPHLGIERPLISEAVSTNIRPISFFLDQKDDRSLQVPKKLLGTKAAWCFDIVSPTDRRSSCFTSSYGRYIRGTGSIVYDDLNFESTLVSPEERDFQEDWTENYDLSKLRYFSGTELARLFGFSDNFSFPSDCTTRQQWKLIGNSLNIKVTSRIVELGLRLMNSKN